MNFGIVKLPIEGPLVIESKVYRDTRGCFYETYSRQAFARLGIDVEFVQDNCSFSKRGTLRGMHFQKRHPQAKLVYVLQGRAFDVVIDLRKGSPCFGQWHGEILDAQSKRLLYVPVGFAHGFLALSDSVEFAYKCSDYYRPDDEGGLLWSDPDVGIDWPLQKVGEPLLSDRDQKWPRLNQLDFYF